jgi:hypothetical protein
MWLGVGLWAGYPRITACCFGLCLCYRELGYIWSFAWYCVKTGKDLTGQECTCLDLASRMSCLTAWGTGTGGIIILAMAWVRTGNGSDESCSRQLVESEFSWLRVIGQPEVLILLYVDECKS